MKDSHVKLICSEDIVYSEHDVDECLEYRDGSGRVQREMRWELWWKEL